MKKTFPALALLALTATAATAHADDSALARAQLRQNLSNFWGVAEDKARAEIAAPARHTREPVTVITPGARAAILNERYTAVYGRNQVVVHQPVVLQPPPPQKTVQMQQQTHHSKDDKKFGLTLFGGLKLFQFNWGDESSSETDALTGSL